jgi:hypothetical protein
MAKKLSRTTLLMRAKRRAWVKEGLTTKGQERINQSHPELKGLGGNSREYHTRFVRWQRAQDKLNWETV